MRLRDFLNKRKTRRATRLLLTDWTTGWNTRDWADLPTHHPRRDDDAAR